MAKMQIKKISYRHEGVATWMLTNPDKSLSDCAAALGYTKVWISTLANTDAFQAYYQARAKEFGAFTTQSIHNKLRGLASICIDEAAERVTDNRVSERFLGDVMRDTLKSLGYGATEVQPLEIHRHEHLHVDSTLLEQARERALAPKDGSTPAKLTTVDAPLKEQIA
jgi:hypothetical protein